MSLLGLRSAALLAGVCALVASACSAASDADGADTTATGTGPSGSGGSSSGGAGGAEPIGGNGAGAGGRLTGSSTASAGAGGSTIPPINDGFIGGPCSADGDCLYEGAICLSASEGFPGGMCSLDCALLCPDNEGSATTFCVTPEDLGTKASEGLCAMQCAFDQSPTGCRSGYECRTLGRFSEPATIRSVCVPEQEVSPLPTACQQALFDRGVDFSAADVEPESPEGAPDLVCWIDDPIWLMPRLHEVTFRPGDVNAEPEPLLVDCSLAASLELAALVLADRDVTDVVHYGTYQCRYIAGSTKLSEHAFGRAIDIAAVRRTSGAVYTVLDDWQKNTPNPTTEAAAFLKDLITTCYDDEIFHIILTPDYNADHADHFHCDLTPGERFFQ